MCSETPKGDRYDDETIRIIGRLAKLQGALDAIEAVKTGVEQNSRMAEKAAFHLFASIRAAVDSREKTVLKVPNQVELERPSRHCSKSSD